MVLIRGNKRGQNNFACKSPTFRAAKLKGFTAAISTFFSNFSNVLWFSESAEYDNQNVEIDHRNNKCPSYPSRMTDTACWTGGGNGRCWYGDTGVRWRQRRHWRRFYKHLRIDINRHAWRRVTLRALLRNRRQCHFCRWWLHTWPRVSPPHVHSRPSWLLGYHLRRRQWQLISVVQRPNLHAQKCRHLQTGHSLQSLSNSTTFPGNGRWSTKS